MKKEKLNLNGIPMVLWGEKSEKVILATHGNYSSKEDPIFSVVAEKAEERGWQLLTHDLPLHGERKGEDGPILPQNCRKEEEAIYDYASKTWNEISIFGCSMGAFFQLLSYGEKSISKAFFLSPVLNMYSLLLSMMESAGVTEKELEEKRVIPTSTETLIWDYYSFVKENQISSWPIKTYILRGERDELCPREEDEIFLSSFGGEYKTSSQSAHWFHSDYDMEAIRAWLSQSL